MKQANFILLLFVLVLGFIACEKEKLTTSGGGSTTLIDYRDKYVGNYKCHKICTFWTLSQPQIDTTFNDTLSLEVKKHPVYSNKIIVGTDEIPMDTSGYYTGYYNPSNYKNYAISFYNDSISISTFNGGLGGGTSCNTKGHR